MAQTNIPENIKDCGKDNFERFIRALNSDKTLNRTAYRPADEKAPYIRYRYVYDNHRVMLSYNIKADILSIDTDAEALEKFKNLFAGAMSQPEQQKNIVQPKPKAPEPAPKAPQPQPVQRVAKPEPKTPQPAPKTAKPAPKAPQPAQRAVRPEPKTPQPAQKAAKPEPSDSTAALEYKDGLYLKNYTSEALERVIKIVKAMKGVVVKHETAKINGAGDVKIYIIEDAAKQKMYLRYFAKKQALQLQGKKDSSLNFEIVPVIVKNIDYKAAVSSYIAQSGEDGSAAGVEKKLKKLIPAAFEFLTEQSKKYFTFAFIDISNEENKLSDYSVLLSSPYKGLERLIYDLQIAESISVKMIGQAFERNDKGEHSLKLGYRKKIPSVIYNEVMSALYKEYFEKRNFYMHSDNSEVFELRSITEKAEVKRIFDNLLNVVNYNCIKLKEIGFSIDKNKR